MCGIVGLFLKTGKYEGRLGELTSGMLRTMSDRGPDSAGFAVYGSASGHDDNTIKVTLRAAGEAELKKAVAAMEAHLGVALDPVYRDTHAVVSIPAARAAAACAFVDETIEASTWSGPDDAWRSTRRSGFPRRFPSASISPR